MFDTKLTFHLDTLVSIQSAESRQAWNLGLAFYCGLRFWSGVELAEKVLLLRERSSARKAGCHGRNLVAGHPGLGQEVEEGLLGID